MKNKKIVLTLLSIVVFLGIGGLSLLAFFSYKIRDVKEPLLAAFKSQIDGDVKIGKAKVVIFPAGIDLEDIQLYAPNETIPSASIKQAKLRFDLIPLIQKKIETSVKILEPEIHLHRDRNGTSNMERIFAPVLKGESKGRVSKIDQLWWKRLAVIKLLIDDAHFIATEEGSKDITELKNLTVEADHIRFEAANKPAKIRIRYELPRVSKEPMELKSKLVFDDAKQNLHLEEGKFHWGPMKMNFGGEAKLPNEAQKEVVLNFHFDSPPIDLKKLAKILINPLPASGTLGFRGTITGTAFAPLLNLILDSPSLNISEKNLSNLHAELSKKNKPIEIKNTSFGIYDGSINLNGQATLGDTVSTNLNIALKSLSLAAMSGNKENGARLSGNLQMAGNNIQRPESFSGGGKISVGPFPLPVVNLQNKVRVADILTAGTGLSQMVNVGMLSSSANVIGTRIDQINATVRMADGNIFLNPFSMGNDHFNATGNGTIVQQKSINASGIFTLNSNVTARLLTDPRFRSVMTNGKESLSVPFSANGPLSDPSINVDSNYLKNLAAKATAMGISHLLAGGMKPSEILNSAIKNKPLGNSKRSRLLDQVLFGK